MNRIYITIWMLTISLVINAQQAPIFSWNRGVGSTGYDKVFDMTVDNSNNIITVGQFGATVSFDPAPSSTPPAISYGTATGIYDMFIAKYNPSGNLAWVKTLGGPGQDYANSVAVDADNNVYAFGDFYDNIDYNPGAAGTHTFTGQSGLSDMILLKYDSLGTLLWAKQIGGNSIDHSSALTIDSHGDLYLTGTFWHTADFNPDTAVADTLASLGQGDVFISKYDKDGNFIWVKQIGAPSFQNVDNITVDNNNDVIISGTFSDSPDFDPSAAVDSIPVTTQYGNVVYFAKYDLNGNYIWAKGIQSNGFKSIGELVTDNTGSFYITGAFKDSTDFDPTNGTNIIFAPQGNSFIYFGKYDASGNLMWVKYIDHPGLGGQDMGKSIAIDAQNNLFLTGQFWGQNCDFNPAPLPTDTAILGSHSSNNYDIFIAKYTNTGNYIWAHNIGDSGSDLGVKIDFDSDNSLIFATICGSSSFGGAALPSDYDFTAGVSEYASAGSEDFTITKYMQCFISPAIGLVGNTITAFANNVSYQWLNCNVGYATIANATSQSYTPTVTGNYACTMTSGGCVDTTICVFVNTCNINTNSTVNGTTISAISQAGATYQWVNCGVGYAAISGATSTTYTPNASGNYAAIITIGTCSDTTTCTTINLCNVNTTVTVNNLILSAATATGATYQWLDCNNNKVAIAGATNQTYTGVFGGNYAVAISLNGCVDTSVCHSINACGINNNVIINNITLSSLESAAGVSYKWLTCNQNGTFTVIAGATAQSYTPSANGSYAVAVTLNGCTDTSDCKSIDKVGLEEFTNGSKVVLFPNPAHNFVIASFTNVTSNISIQTFDVLGNLVDAKTSNAKNNITINTESLSKGVYFVKFIETSTNNAIVKRFVKE